jgi:hypothetical protein
MTNEKLENVKQLPPLMSGQHTNCGDDSERALETILSAWSEGEEAGIPSERLAYAALFSGLRALVDTIGEEEVARFAAGLENRVRLGEFSEHNTRQ